MKNWTRKEEVQLVLSILAIGLGIWTIALSVLR